MSRRNHRRIRNRGAQFVPKLGTPLSAAPRPPPMPRVEHVELCPEAHLVGKYKGVACAAARWLRVTTRSDSRSASGGRTGPEHVKIAVQGRTAAVKRTMVVGKAQFMESCGAERCGATPVTTSRQLCQALIVAPVAVQARTSRGGAMPMLQITHSVAGEFTKGDVFHPLPWPLCGAWPVPRSSLHRLCLWTLVGSNLKYPNQSTARRFLRLLLCSMPERPWWGRWHVNRQWGHVTNPGIGKTTYGPRISTRPVSKVRYLAAQRTRFPYPLHPQTYACCYQVEALVWEIITQRGDPPRQTISSIKTDRPKNQANHPPPTTSQAPFSWNGYGRFQFLAKKPLKDFARIFPCMVNICPGTKRTTVSGSALPCLLKKLLLRRDGGRAQDRALQAIATCHPLNAHERKNKSNLHGDATKPGLDR